MKGKRINAIQVEYIRVWRKEMRNEIGIQLRGSAEVKTQRHGHATHLTKMLQISLSLGSPLTLGLGINLRDDRAGHRSARKSKIAFIVTPADLFIPQYACRAAKVLTS